MTEVEDKQVFSELNSLYTRAYQQFVRVWELYKISEKCENLIVLAKQHSFLAVLISSFFIFSILPTLIFVSVVIASIGFGFVILIIAEVAFVGFATIVLISTYLFTGSAAIFVAVGFLFVQYFLKVIQEFFYCVKKNQIFRNRINSLKRKDGTVFESVAPQQEHYEADSSSVKCD